MGIQLTLTDDDAQRYLKWAANIRQPRQPAEPAPMESGTGNNAPSDLAARREQLKDIRKWANKHGFRISGRGRIPQTVMAAYEASNGR